MALWKPKDIVEKKEHIGRRLFQRKPLKGAPDQARPADSYELYHFQQPEPDVSVDRLGASGVDKKVIKNYLNPRSHYAATKFIKKTPFLGWAVAKVEDFQKPFIGDPIDVTASPIKSQLVEEDAARNDLEANEYHADLNRPADHNALFMAFRLKSIFENRYRMEPCIEQREITIDPKSLSWYQRFRLWVDDLRNSR